MDALRSKLRDASAAGVALTKSDCLLLLEHTTSVLLTLKFERSRAVLKNNLDRPKLSVDFLKDQALNTWSEALIDTQFSLYTDKDTNLEVNDAYLQACVPGISVYARTKQKGFFSDFAETEALDYAGIKQVLLVQNDHTAFSPPKHIEDDDPLLLETMKELGKRHNLYDPIEEGCEYTRREFISPILILAATISGVKLACEEQVDGSAGKGPVDWAAHYANHRICITEGKKDNLTQGLYQNLAQLAAAGVDCGQKSSFCVDLPMYGIATIFELGIHLPGSGFEGNQLYCRATQYSSGCFHHPLLSPNCAGCCFSASCVLFTPKGYG